MAEFDKTLVNFLKADTLPQLTAWRVLEGLGESVAVMSLDYRIIWFKEPDVLPIKPDCKMIGEPCFRAFYDRKEPCQYRCPVRPVIEGGVPNVEERFFVDFRGRERWREARAFPIVDSRGEMVLVVRISYDITARKMAQVREQRHKEDLERALEEMNRLSLEETPFAPTGEIPDLTKREVEVLRLLAQGLSKPRIAGVLTISPNTVKRHVDNIFNKLGVNDRTQAAIWAARQHLI